MAKKVNDLRRKLGSIKEAHRDCEERMTELDYKRKHIEERMPRLKGAVVTAETKKEQVLQLHVSGEATAEEVKNARGAVEAAQRAVDEAHEFINAAIKRRAVLNSDHQKLMTEYSQTLRDCWAAAYEEIKSELAGIQGLQAKVRRAYIMSNLSAGGGGNFGLVLQDLFGGLPGNEELTGMISGLQKEFAPEGGIEG